MLIGNQYSDNKIYRGIRHYDHLPLLSGDIHEYTDTMYMKNAYIMNNLLGYGTLNTPRLTISSDGVKLAEPVVVLIDGDVSLIQSDDDSPILRIEDVKSKGGTTGVLCILGWYQAITANSTLRNYGGVDNSILPNDLLHEELNIQVSSRYQFRWMTVVLPESYIYNTEISGIGMHQEDRDASGKRLGTFSDIQFKRRSDNVFVAPPATSMDYALSDLYLVPILKYEYDGSSERITQSSVVLPITPKGSSGFIESESTPVGEYANGTTWYNPVTQEFKTYVAGSGFISSTSKMGFLQYQSVHTFPRDISTAQDIQIPIDISEFREGDILQVIYEGLILVADEHYTVDYENHTITLLGFTVRANDSMTFTVTKIVEANNITNITTLFTSHMATKSSGTVEAHVKLSDDTDSDLDENSGVAATPKSVKESKYIIDDSTNTRYKFGVENGILYLEEV